MGRQQTCLDTLPPDVISAISMHLPPPSTRSLRLAHPRLSSASFNPLFISADHVVRAVEHCCTTALPELIHASSTPRALSWAAYRNNLAALRLLLSPPVGAYPIQILGDAILTASEKNHVDALAMLLVHVPMPDTLVQQPSSGRQSDVAKQWSTIATNAFIKAAALGNVQTTRMLEPHASAEAFDSAASEDGSSFLTTASSCFPAVVNCVRSWRS